MKSEITPITEEQSALKDNLITTSQPEQKKIINTNQFFVDEDKFSPSSNRPKKIIISFKENDNLLCFLSFIFCLILVINIILISFLPFNINSIIIILVVIFFLLAILIMKTLELEITKDIEKGIVIIRIMNLLCFAKKTIVLDVENTFFDLEKETVNVNGNFSQTTNLHIYNNYKNIVGFDLDESDIKQKPVTFFYIFKGIDLNQNNHTSQLINDLYALIETSYTEDKNPYN